MQQNKNTKDIKTHHTNINTLVFSGNPTRKTCLLDAAILLIVLGAIKSFTKQYVSLRTYFFSY